MTYAVFGVSGNTGRVVAETLLASKKSVRVIVRDPKKGEPWKAKGAEIAVADLSDSAAVGLAMSGCESAYLLIPPNMSVPDFRAYQRQVAEALTDAVRKSQVAHVVFLSSIGANRSEGTGPILGLHWAEEDLKKLVGARMSFVRAAYFMENLAGSLGMFGQGVLPSFLPAGLAIPMIATRDIGKLCASLLVEGATANQVIELGSPARSMKDVAQVLSKLTGRTIRVQEMPVDSMATTLAAAGLPKGVAALYQEMTQGMASGHIAFEGGHRRVDGTTKLEDVLGPLVAK